MGKDSSLFLSESPGKLSLSSVRCKHGNMLPGLLLMAISPAMREASLRAKGIQRKAEV